MWLGQRGQARRRKMKSERWGVGIVILAGFREDLSFSLSETD